MQIDAIALVLRPRSVWEGCDLGVRLLQAWLRSVHACYLAVALPVFALCLGTYSLEPWLPSLLIWLAKPWLDRTILFALSRALFGASTHIADVWAARREVWRPSVLSLIHLRLSASRSFKLPVMQLEGLAGRAQRDRLRQITLRHRGVARTMTVAFANAEVALWASLLVLPAWLAPHVFGLDANPWASLFASSGGLVTSVGYAAAVAFLEPFYVAAGFGLYLNRRVELEAWDIEQEFRRAFAR